jgi:uncharacterized protein (DUF1810 family)
MAVTDSPPENFDLERFVTAQQPLYAQACAELAAGHKASHWMWWIFPQLRGLGSSPTAQRFGIGSLAEACAYLDHPLLGPRLRECTQLVNGLTSASAQAIFGYPDYLKFRSCMTLFAAAAGRDDTAFAAALQKYFAGEADPLTRKLLT